MLFELEEETENVDSKDGVLGNDEDGVRVNSKKSADVSQLAEKLDILMELLFQVCSFR